MHRRCHTVSPSRRGRATPHLNVHYRLSYASDKLIKNTIWMGLSFVLYFQSSSFLPCPTGNFCPNLCHFVYKTILPKSSILSLCLSGFPLPFFSYIPIITKACARSKGKGEVPEQKLLFPLCTIAILLRRI